ALRAGARRDGRGQRRRRDHRRARADDPSPARRRLVASGHARRRLPRQRPHGDASRAVPEDPGRARRAVRAAALPGGLHGLGSLGDALMLTLYRAPWSTNVQRVTMALAYKRLGYESVEISYADRSPVLEVSGQPLVPVLVDD